MGCWFETCGFSNLPINEGDEVLWTIIKRVDRSRFDKNEELKPQYIERHADEGSEPWTGRRGDDLFYPFDVWQPVVVFAQGTYDDYGGVEMPEEVWAMYRTYLEGEGIELKRNPFGGNLRVNDRQLVLPPDHQFWMMRRDCFDALADLPVTDWFRDAKTIVESEQKKFAEVREFIVERLANPMNFAIRSIGDTFGRIEAPSFSFYYEGVIESTSVAREHGIDAALIWLENYMKVQRVYVAMTVLRKSLAPTVGKGSQDWSAGAHCHMAQYIQRVCQEYMDDFD